MPSLASPEDIRQFWFTETSPKQWYKKDLDFDRLIAERFGKTITAALAGRLDRWADNAPDCLALILILDQFTRNVFRNNPRAFSGDEMALALSLRCVERGYLDSSVAAHKQFMLMPMMHSEELAIQDQSLPLFAAHTGAQTHEYAVKHRDIIAEFGRFPHRNKILGRPSTPAELAFLEQPGSSF